MCMFKIIGNYTNSRRILNHLKLFQAQAQAEGFSSSIQTQGFSTNAQAHRLSNNKASARRIKFLSQSESQNIDNELMGDKYGFQLEQLMELAGLSVANAVATEFQPIQKKRILVVCGPGNNGGDGLVAARHLFFYHAKPVIYYPKKTDRPIFHGLVKQCTALGIKIIENPTFPYDVGTLESEFDLIIDGIFGFGFKKEGGIRDPFNTTLRILSQCKKAPIVSIDIPSGWDVEKGKSNDDDEIDPYMLVSLTAPKLCAKSFTGVHWLGGRFVPPDLENKYELNLPNYSGIDCIVKLSNKL